MCWDQQGSYPTVIPYRSTLDASLQNYYNSYNMSQKWKWFVFRIDPSGDVTLVESKQQ